MNAAEREIQENTHSRRNHFGIQFRSVHVRFDSETRVCFVTPGAFESSVLALRHVTNFDIPWCSSTKRERGGKVTRVTVRVFRGRPVMVSTRFCGCRGGVFDLFPFLRLSLPLIVSLFISLSFSFFDLLSPYKYTLPHPSFDLHPPTNTIPPLSFSTPPDQIAFPFFSFRLASFDPLSLTCYPFSSPF